MLVEIGIENKPRKLWNTFKTDNKSEVSWVIVTHGWLKRYEEKIN